MIGHDRTGVQPGEGIVARFGAVAAAIGPGPDAFTDPLLDLLAEPAAPVELLWSVAALVASRRPDVPPFVLLVGDREDRRVVRYGTARVLFDGAEPGSGDVWTWREDPVPAGTHTVALTVVDGPVTPHPHTNLRDGTSRGTGLVLQVDGGGPRVPTPPTKPAPPRSPGAQPVASQAGFAPVTPAHPLDEPTPALGRGAPVPAPPISEVVPGDTVVLAADLLALESADGRRVPLDRDYVIGRNPRQDPSVTAGSASPVRVPEDDNLVSRVHAFVDVRGDAVVVRDSASANGTFFARPGDREWTRIGREPVQLALGWSIRIGRQVYTVVGKDSG